MNPPPVPPGESGLAIFGQFLKFIGLILTVAGALAILRLRHHDLLVHIHTDTLFYASLMPLGVVVWAAGFMLIAKAASSPSAPGRE